MKVITTKIYSIPLAREKKRNGQSCKHSSSVVSDQAGLQMLETVGILKCLETPADF